MADHKPTDYLYKTSALLSKDRLNKIQDDDDDGGSGGSGKKKGHSFKDVHKAIAKGNVKAEAVAGFLKKQGTDHQSVGDKATSNLNRQANASAKSAQNGSKTQAQSAGIKQNSSGKQGSVAGSFLNQAQVNSLANPNSIAGKQTNTMNTLFAGKSRHGNAHGNPLGIGKQSGSIGTVLGTRPTGMGRS